MRNWQRLTNTARAHYDMYFRRTTLGHRPRYMMIEPTNACNLACPLCPTGTGKLRAPRGMMNFERYVELLDELTPTLETLQLWGFGEPLMHPDIFRMVEAAHERGMVTKISTNGQFFETNDACDSIVSSGLDQLRVSLDGLSDETLRVYRRGASIEPIVEGLRRIRKAKKHRGSKTPSVVLQFIRMQHNEHEADILPELAALYGATWRIKTVSVGPAKSSGYEAQFLPKGGDSRYAAHDCDDGCERLAPASAPPRVCPFPWLWAHVNWDGTVVPCCKDPHRQHLVGNAFEDGGFMKVWNSDAYVSFRERYLADPRSLTRCRRCDYPFKRT